MRWPRVSRLLLPVLVAALSVSACTRRAVYAPLPAATGGPYVAAPGAAFAAQPYALNTGDRLRISVFGQEGVTNTYIVDAGGFVNVALIGPVGARGLTPPGHGDAQAVAG